MNTYDELTQEFFPRYLAKVNNEGGKTRVEDAQTSKLKVSHMCIYFNIAYFAYNAYFKCL